MAKEITRLAVIGSGIMGNGIAQIGAFGTQGLRGGKADDARSDDGDICIEAVHDTYHRGRERCVLALMWDGLFDEADRVPFFGPAAS